MSPPPSAPRRAAALLLALCASCGRDEPAPRASPEGSSPAATAPAANPAADPVASSPDVVARQAFRDVTATSGVAFVHRNGATGRRYMPETMGSGVAVLDFDGDSRQDLYFVNSGDIPEPGAPPARGGNRLYRNLGDWRFEDVTERAGVEGRGYGMGAASADVDADGDADLLVTGFGSTVLYLNDGDGTFTDATASSGVGDDGWTTGAAFLDADGDGRLDLFLQRYVRWSVPDHRPCRRNGVEAYCTPDLLDPAPSRLLRGRGDGTFEDASKASGVGAHPGKGLGVIASDLDGDGDADIYCANDTYKNLLFVNRGDGSFDEQGLLSGAAYGADGRAEAGMGVDAGDVDGDLQLDVIVGNFQREPIDVYRNEGGMAFTEVSASSGVAAASRERLTFGVRLLDYDGDGNLDLAAANGHVFDNAPQADRGTTHAQPGLLMRGMGGGRFEDVTATAGGALAAPRVGRGLASADLDDDGDLDLVVTSNGGRAELLENVAPRRSWLSVRCVAARDPFGLGARVTLEAAGRAQVQEVRSGGSYLSQSDLRLHFGLGDADAVDRVTVRWPGGRIETAENVVARRPVTFVEGRGLQR